MSEHPEHPEHEPSLTELWDERYAATDRVWSGKPNAALIDTVSSIAPKGRALDVGCGEGADVLWLAAQGWDAEGIDLSQVAISRAQSQAQTAGVPAQFHTTDAEQWARTHQDSYALVSAAFLHTHGADDRAALLRRAASMVAPGGWLFILSHASPPPWAHSHAPDLTPGTPELDRDLA
ncbi:MAG TPA: class I SAM-dependent methyltransferase, partial [Terrimesophilobacter sp.]|nr:class I SAM-dependent methyltransferase [Terrimesophilobacter sp.]